MVVIVGAPMVALLVIVGWVLVVKPMTINGVAFAGSANMMALHVQDVWRRSNELGPVTLACGVTGLITACD